MVDDKAKAKASAQDPPVSALQRITWSAVARRNRTSGTTTWVLPRRFSAHRRAMLSNTRSCAKRRNRMKDTQPIHVRKGQADEQLDHKTFHARFMVRYTDPAFREEDEALARLEAIAWDTYREGRKAPLTHKAGLASPTHRTTRRSTG